MILKQTENVK